jgi:hypothetical protein
MDEIYLRRGTSKRAIDPAAANEAKRFDES